ncbi:hypothetical protein BDN67DRAFT_985691 [Paxillus ammoniavirescens]|nr:hypothetical protein BDN67DRAFT_985691 [Paxillus ammoniavirescens]
MSNSEILGPCFSIHATDDVQAAELRRDMASDVMTCWKLMFTEPSEGLEPSVAVDVSAGSTLNAMFPAKQEDISLLQHLTFGSAYCSFIRYHVVKKICDHLRLDICRQAGQVQEISRWDVILWAGITEAVHLAVPLSEHAAELNWTLVKLARAARLVGAPS